MSVSVIIPCYNVEQYIEACLKSIEKQTFRDLEVICVDDGSSDQTANIVEKVAATAALPIQLVRQENKGAPSARNNGITHSKGAYIQFLDADDLLQPNKIEHQIGLAQKNDFPDLIAGSYLRENMKGEFLNQRIYDDSKLENVWMHLLKTDLGNTCSNLFKADLFKQGIKWNQDLQSSQEYNLMFEILKKGAHILFDPEIHTVIRVRDSGSISQKNRAQKWERYVQLRIDIVDYLKSNFPALMSDEVFQILFTCIRMLYPHNPEKALSFYNQYMPKGFVPKASNAIGKNYVLLYKLLGFRNTEKLRGSFSKNKAH